MADEAGFLELLVANERIGRWLDILCDPYQRNKHKHAIQQLQQDLQRGASYVEEANRLGAVPVLTKLLSSTTDEATLDELSSMIALCSGPMACGGKVCSFTYGEVTVAVREGALGDGLGAKVWSVCHIMVRELLADPEIFHGQQVLELGSGTGLVGLVAALAGAQQVVLTDHEDKVLVNLRTCMHMNAARHQAPAPTAQGTAANSTAQPCHPQHPQAAAAAAAASSTTASQLDQHHPPQQQQQQQQEEGDGACCIPDDAELFDDAESVEDFNLAEFTSDPAAAAAAAGGGGGGCDGRGSSSNNCHNTAAAAAEAQTAWEVGNMCVRLLDWQESEDALLKQEEQQQAHQQHQPQDKPQQHWVGASSGSSEGPPHVPLSQRFPVVLGNEVMYEAAHARLVAAAIRHRLEVGGRALLCCAVRDQAVFDEFRDSCLRWGLRYRAIRVQPQGDEELGGIVGRERDYEGGFLLMAVDHVAAPAADWHRDDFAAVC